MRFGMVLLLTCIAGCAGLDRPALEGYDAIRAAIAVSTDAETGMATADSARAALEKVTPATVAHGDFDEAGLLSGTSAGVRARETMFVQAEKAADGAVAVFLVSVESYPVFRTAIQEKPWTETEPDRRGYVGDPWREVKWELVEFRMACDALELRCVRHSTDRMRLTEDDVRALLASGQDEVRVSYASWRTVDWRIDKDELLAVLDALGARERFR